MPNVAVGKGHGNCRALRGLAAERHVVVEIEVVVDGCAGRKAADVGDSTQVALTRIAVADRKDDFGCRHSPLIDVHDLRAAGTAAHVLRHGNEALLNGDRILLLGARGKREAGGESHRQN